MCGADAGCLAINYQSPPLVLPSLFVAGRGVRLKGRHRGHGCVSQLLTRSGGGQVWTTKLHDGHRGCICTTAEEESAWFPECPVISCGYVWSIAFSPDGDRVVSGAQHGAVHIWSAATGAQVRNAWESVSCFSVVWSGIPWKIGLGGGLVGACFADAQAEGALQPTTPSSSVTRVVTAGCRAGAHTWPLWEGCLHMR